MLDCHVDKGIVIDADKQFCKHKTNFVNFLEKDCNLTVYYDEISVEEQNVLSLLFQGRRDSKINFICNTCLSQSDNLEDFENPYKVILVDEEDKGKQEEIKYKTQLLIGFINNYEEIIDKLTKSKTVSVNGTEYIDSFKEYSDLFLDMPVTEIILVDIHLLDYSEKNPLENNYYKFLRYLFYHFPNLKKVLIFTNIKLDIKKVNPNIRREIILKSKEILGDKIQFRLDDASGRSPFHFRGIYTNYFYVKLGISLNAIYSNNGNFSYKKIDDIELKPYGIQDVFYSSNRRLKDIYAILQESNKCINDRAIASISSKLFFKIDDNDC